VSGLNVDWGPKPRRGDPAVLVGTVEDPVVELRFERKDRHATTGVLLAEWVKDLPGRRWNKAKTCWEVRATGPDPAKVIGAAGFGSYFVDLDDPFVSSLDDVTKPLVQVCDKEGWVTVLPRLTGFKAGREILGGSAVWIGGENRWELPIAALPRPGVEYGDGVVAAIGKSRQLPDEVKTAAATLAASVDMVQAGADGTTVLEAVGDVPAWFGLQLDGYQRAGAIASVAGHRLIADEMGLGKTRTALAAAAIVGARRTVVTCPPSTLTGWMREASSSKLADWTTFIVLEEADGTGELGGGELGAGSTERGDAPPTKPRPVDPGAGESLADRPPLAVPDGYISPRVVAFRSGRKEPELPDAGVVIVPDSLLQKRPAVLAKLIEWKPDVVICDEAHRAKTFWSDRAKTLRRIAQAARKLPIALTGTTLFANTFELAGVLDIAGHLGPTFGGFDGFVAKFCKEGRFGGFVTNKKMLPELKALLDEKVWVRRVKADVAKDLPAKRRVPKLVDVDLSSYKAAHTEVLEVIDAWIDSHVEETGDLPKMAEIQAWAKHEVSLVARLRKAAGLVKVPAAVDWVTNFVTTHADPDAETFDRPLIVWAHHTEVVEALIDAVPSKFPAAGVIVGSTSGAERTRVIDAYQAGQIPVLVASIHAASVGITLTRGCDALVVEADVTPAIMAQLEDRQARRGQTRPVTITTLVAPGTFDMRVQQILGGKGEVLDHLHVGADDDVAVLDVDDSEALRPFELVCELAVERLEAARRRHRRKAA
jgi:hypothetical protein